MNRISFRQGMLLGFMLIVLLLGGVAIQSWLVVERLVDQSRRSSEQAIQLTAGTAVSMSTLVAAAALFFIEIILRSVVYRKVP